MAFVSKNLGRAAARVAAPLLWSNFWSRQTPLPDGFWKGRSAAVTVSFDLDYPQDVEAVPRLLDVLETHDVQTSFAIVGKFYEKDASPIKQIAKARHELINHSYTHPNGYWNPSQFFNDLSVRAQEAEIRKCHDLVKKETGVTMVGFRTPHFGDQHAGTIYPLLQKLGYEYSSSTLGTRVGRLLPFVPKNQTMLELPVMTCPAHYYPVFDSYHSFRTEPGAHAEPGEFLTQFQRAVRMCIWNRAYANFYFDPLDIADTSDFAQALEWLDSIRDQIWLASSRDVARHWHARRPRGSYAKPPTRIPAPTTPHQKPTYQYLPELDPY